MVLLVELLLQICTTIGLCTIMYVIGNQPITRFAVIVWTITSAIISTSFKLYDKYKLKKVNKEINNHIDNIINTQDSITKDLGEAIENKENLNEENTSNM